MAGQNAKSPTGWFACRSERFQESYQKATASIAMLNSVWTEPGRAVAAGDPRFGFSETFMVTEKLLALALRTITFSSTVQKSIFPSCRHPVWESLFSRELICMERPLV